MQCSSASRKVRKKQEEIPFAVITAHGNGRASMDCNKKQSSAETGLFLLFVGAYR
jgi:hypothetical protein